MHHHYIGFIAPHVIEKASHGFLPHFFDVGATTVPVSRRDIGKKGHTSDLLQLRFITVQRVEFAKLLVFRIFNLPQSEPIHLSTQRFPLLNLET